MLSTDPSYGNRTIAITLKLQIWMATNNRDVSRVMKTKFPAKVMVFGVVSSEGHIIPPHIFEVGLKVNTKVYLDGLKSVVKCIYLFRSICEISFHNALISSLKLSVKKFISDFISWGRSFINIKKNNKKGPSRDPWRTQNN